MKGRLYQTIIFHETTTFVSVLHKVGPSHTAILFSFASWLLTSAEY